MKLSENYKRFFGSLPTTPEPIKPLTEDQKTKWGNMNHVLGTKFPNVPLTIHEGKVYAGGKKMGLASEYLDKPFRTIHEEIRVLSLQKGNQ